MITDIESEQLTSDIDNIKRGNYDIFNTRKNLESEVENMLLNLEKEAIQESFSLEQPQPQKTEDAQPFFNEEFIEGFLSMTNPMLYRQYKIMKGEGDPLLSIMKQYNNLVKTANKLNRMYKPKKNRNNYVSN